MRKGLVTLLIFSLTTFWFATTSFAQLNANDLMRLGVEILQGPQDLPLRPVPERAPPKARAAPSSPREQAIVATVQRRLSELGYPVGAVDGKTGSRTRQAIADFQRDQGLPITGVADESLLSALNTATPVASPSVAAGPSFDCQNVRQPAEAAICSSPDLAALDRRLARDYGTAAAQGAPPERQLQWLAERNRCGGDPVCLEGSYRRRLSEIGSVAQAEEVPGSETAFRILDGYDLPQHDYRSGMTERSLSGIGAAGCQTACAADGRCTAFTYNTRGKVCILKDQIPKPKPFAGAVSGIKGTGADVDGLAALPSYADFVHMALMSDVQAYMTQAGLSGIAYMRAVGSEEQCRHISEVAQKDEFERRDYLATAADRFRDVVASLPNRVRSAEIPVEGTLRLGEYDFDRQGFPLNSQSAPSVLQGGTVSLPGSQRPYLCNGQMYSFGGDYNNAPNFDNLVAEHPGLPGIDFLPMPTARARLFRATGQTEILLKASMVIEPRTEGRGPLRGHVVALAAHDPTTGALLHRYEIAQQTSPTAEGDGVPWSSKLLAELVSPAYEFKYDKGSFDMAASQYFSRHQSAINAGNSPPDLPLPIDAMRGRQPEVIVALNRERLREKLRSSPISLPLTVTVEEQYHPYYDETTGVQFAAFVESDKARQPEPLDRLYLSSRDLPVYTQLSFVNGSRGQEHNAGFREMMTTGRGRRQVLELDRILDIPPFRMGIEAAAARGLVGSSQKRDTVTLRWVLEIQEVRNEDLNVLGDTTIIGARLVSLSYRWTSDNVPIDTVNVGGLATVRGLRKEPEEPPLPVVAPETPIPPNDETAEPVIETGVTAPTPVEIEPHEVAEPAAFGLDILGIRLGVSFEDADKVIRDHMEVGRVPLRRSQSAARRGQRRNRGLYVGPPLCVQGRDRNHRAFRRTAGSTGKGAGRLAHRSASQGRSRSDQPAGGSYRTLWGAAGRSGSLATLHEHRRFLRVVGFRGRYELHDPAKRLPGRSLARRGWRHHLVAAFLQPALFSRPRSSDPLPVQFGHATAADEFLHTGPRRALCDL